MHVHRLVQVQNTHPGLVITVRQRAERAFMST
jgi:hypothetical protein